MNNCREQNQLKLKLIEFPSTSIQKISKIGGLDISFSKYDKNLAVVTLVVLDFISLEILYENSKFVKITQPYVPGFLAFREVEHLKLVVDELRLSNPAMLPDVFIVDGNGILHSNRFGLACHLGVLCDVPTIGCGKTFFYVDGITALQVEKLTHEKLKNIGDHIILKGKSGSVWGAAYKSSRGKEPMIISPGHRMNLELSIMIVKKVTKYKVNEPIRLADKISRSFINNYDYENFYENQENEYDDEYYFSQI